MCVYIIVISLAVLYLNFNNVLASEIHITNSAPIHRQNSISKNLRDPIENHTNSINENQGISKLFSSTNAKKQSLVNLIQGLKGTELMTYQPHNVAREISKDMASNNMMKFQLRADDSYRKDNPIIVNFTLYNLSTEDLWVLKWYTPLEGVKGKIFNVICDGKQVSYQGPMVKRGQPTKNDYAHIAPGGSVSADTDMSNVYLLPASSQCLVQFKGLIYDFTTSAKIVPKNSEEHQMVNIPGNPITFRIVEH
jgi:hypothetical protein